MEVRITRTDKMPPVCVVCGEPTDNTVVLPFVPRRRVTRKYVWFWAYLMCTLCGGLFSRDPGAVVMTVGLLFLPLLIFATVAVIRRIVLWWFPAIQRRLPVCERHAWQVDGRDRLRIWQLVSALAILYGGAWCSMSTDLLWPLYVSAALFFALLFLTDDFLLRPVEANESAVVLGAAHTEFVEKFHELNRVLTFEIASEVIDEKSGTGINLDR